MQKNKTDKGACEQALTCKQATERCRHDISGISDAERANMRCTPQRRWVDCYAYKQKLGMIFSSKLGVYIIPNCPHCGIDLEKHTERRL